jgi:hypothetical protein
MKKLILPVLLGIAAAFFGPAQAATSLPPAGFSVDVTLTSACQLSTPPGAITLPYTSLGAAKSATTSFDVQCTNGLAYTLALSAANADTLGLSIPLEIRKGDDSAVAAGGTQAGAAAATYLIKASITAGQQGTCAGATCTSSVARTLTVSY